MNLPKDIKNFKEELEENGLGHLVLGILKYP